MPSEPHPLPWTLFRIARSWAIAASLAASSSAAANDFFEARVRPVLVEHCQSCHGPEKQKAGLRLDSRAFLLQGGESGPAVVPGNPEASLLLKAVSHADPDLAMPPKKPRLADAVVTVGFSKSTESIDAGLARYKAIAHRVRKTRMMGSAALALAYIACGRLDAYIEESISLWDIAAGQLMLERGGGSVVLIPSPRNPDKSSILSSNGRLPLDEAI